VRPAETVLLGSSTVYRGMRPAELPAGRETFNLGLSSLTAAELPALARMVAARASAGVVIGLDYFMFTEFVGRRRSAARLPTGALEQRPASRP
jgi:hypothetical protein